jgi:hypothetical protein
MRGEARRRAARLLALPLLAFALGLAQVAPAGAAVDVNERFPMSFTFFNSCTGEEVQVAGVVHFLGRAGTGESGQFHLGAHCNPRLSGVGLASGATYQFVQANNGQFNAVGEDGPPLNGSNTLAFRVICQGEDGTEEDFTAYLVFHFTVNANGEGTVDFQKFREECAQPAPFMNRCEGRGRQFNCGEGRLSENNGRPGGEPPTVPEACARSGLADRPSAGQSATFLHVAHRPRSCLSFFGGARCLPAVRRPSLRPG